MEAPSHLVIAFVTNKTQQRSIASPLGNVSPLCFGAQVRKEN